MNNLKRVAGFVFMVAVMTAGMAVALQFAPPLLGQMPAPLVALAVIGIALVLAIVFQLGNVIVEQVSTGDDAPAQHDSLKVAQEFSQRIAGVVEVQELAGATSAVIASHLQVPRTGWLIITPQASTFSVRLITGKGHTAEPMEVSRNNPLLHLLDLKRQPVLLSALEADPKLAQMPAKERDWLKQLGMEVFVPVFDAGVLNAVLMVSPRDNHLPYAPPDVELLTLLAAQAGSALKAMRLIGDLKQSSQSLTTQNASMQETLEALNKMNAARNDFIAIASHELRTPITQLLGFADLLGMMAHENTLNAAEVIEITDSIVRACVRLGEVISEMLEMAQIDVQAVNLNYGDTTVEAILRQAIEPFAEALRERHLNLAVKGLRTVPPIRADEERLVRALTQIISNAIKFTPDNGRIEVSARLIPQDGEQPPCVEVCVGDAGIGLDPKYHALVFEKFYRVGSSSLHSTSTTKFMGAGPGLGLPIAKGVIERHGGRIWMESPGHDPEKLPGTRVFIILPIRPPAFDPRALSASDEATGRKDLPMLPRKQPFVDTD
jgi:signal transduction histidine kinase